jgi:hypothetical protein
LFANSSQTKPNIIELRSPTVHEGVILLHLKSPVINCLLRSSYTLLLGHLFQLAALNLKLRNCKQCRHSREYRPHTHAQASSAEEPKAAAHALLMKRITPRLTVLLAEMQHKRTSKGPNRNRSSCSARRKGGAGDGSGPRKPSSSARECRVARMRGRCRKAKVAVGRPVLFDRRGVCRGVLLVLTAVLYGIAETLSERAHCLVDECGERGAVVALEARVMQVMIPYKCSESNQKSATNTMKHSLVALKVVFVAAVASSRAER